MKDKNYEICCDIANSWKHQKISRNNKLIRGLEDIQEACGICRYVDIQGFYYQTHKFTMLHLTNGYIANLHRVIFSSALFWANELLSLNVIDFIPDILKSYTEKYPRDNELANTQMVIHSVDGEYVNIKFMCFDFDESKKLLVDAAPNTGFDGVANFDIIIHNNFSLSPKSLETP